MYLVLTTFHKDEFLNEDGESFLTKEEIVDKIISKHNLDPEKRTICMCYTGVAATVGYFALHKAGFNNLQVYDGSWSEYGSRKQ